MSSDSDVILDAHLSSDSDIVLEAPEAGNHRGPYRLKEDGPTFLCAVIVDTNSSGRLKDHKCTHPVGGLSSNRFWLIGALTLAWHVCVDNVSNRTTKIVGGVAKANRSQIESYGWAEYCVKSCCKMDPIPMPAKSIPFQSLLGLPNLKK